MDKGKGGKYLILPPGYKEKVPDGYIALPSSTYQRLRPPALQPQERQRRRRRQGRRLRQADQVLSAVAGGQSAADDVRRRDRRRVRRHDSLRPALLRVARPLRAARAVARPRQGDDRSAQVDRHREGQAVQPGREDEAGPQRSGARSPRLARSRVRRRLHAAVLRRHALGPAGVAGGDRRDDDGLRRSRHLSGRRPRRHLFHARSSAPSIWARASSI